LFDSLIKPIFSECCWHHVIFKSARYFVATAPVKHSGQHRTVTSWTQPPTACALCSASQSMHACVLTAGGRHFKHAQSINRLAD